MLHASAYHFVIGANAGRLKRDVYIRFYQKLVFFQFPDLNVFFFCFIIIFI